MISPPRWPRSKDVGDRVDLRLVDADVVQPGRRVVDPGASNSSGTSAAASRTGPPRWPPRTASPSSTAYSRPAMQIVDAAQDGILCSSHRRSGCASDGQDQREEHRGDQVRRGPSSRRSRSIAEARPSRTAGLAGSPPGAGTTAGVSLIGTSLVSWRRRAHHSTRGRDSPESGDPRGAPTRLACDAMPDSLSDLAAGSAGGAAGRLQRRDLRRSPWASSPAAGSRRRRWPG